MHVLKLNMADIYTCVESRDTCPHRKSLVLSHEPHTDSAWCVAHRLCYSIHTRADTVETASFQGHRVLAQNIPLYYLVVYACSVSCVM